MITVATTNMSVVDTATTNVSVTSEVTTLRGDVTIMYVVTPLTCHVIKKFYKTTNMISSTKQMNISKCNLKKITCDYSIKLFNNVTRQ